MRYLKVIINYSYVDYLIILLLIFLNCYFFDLLVRKKQIPTRISGRISSTTMKAMLNTASNCNNNSNWSKKSLTTRIPMTKNQKMFLKLNSFKWKKEKFYETYSYFTLCFSKCIDFSEINFTTSQLFS